MGRTTLRHVHRGRYGIATIAAVALVAAGIVIAAPAEAAFSGTTLVNGRSGSCLDVRGASNAPGTAVQIAACTGAESQRFTTTAASEVRVTIGGVARCLDASGGGTANGNPVIIWTCQGSGNQRWTHNANNSITNTKSGRCLDINGSNPASGTGTILWDCKNGGNGSQTWTPNGTPAPPPPAGGFVVSEAQFNQMFPGRNAFYTYAGLVNAMTKFPAFAKTGTATIQRQEAAAFLANADHETGGLVFITEINKSNDLCDETQSFGCPAGTFAYYGRGPIQLSWNFNYNAAGIALGQPLLTNPFLVEQNASIAWQTGLWYWMTQNGPGTMTAHNAMVNSRGFGETIRSINGSLECNGGNPAQVASRVAAYQRITGILGVTPGANLTC
jgi:predicted chitinase